MKKAGFLCLALLVLAVAVPLRAQKPDSYRDNSRPADTRFKADILVVVAHPDDEVMAAAYLAREIFDNKKRVAVVYQTTGDGGNNEVGAEQAAAMGDIREMEAREAVGSLGIRHVWFLGGHDTPSQNVLASLEHCGHGRCLDELVRIVRITQPTVILTWLPDFVTGENHGDHQASGVLATEAFDVAGDPTVFSEQVSPATDPAGNANMTEGLRPWQPQKLYYFINTSHELAKSLGPEYSSEDVSPSRHESYGVLAAKEFTYHRTQGGDKVEQQLQTLSSATGEIAGIVNRPVRLILGKSLVPSDVTADVFAGTVPEGIAWVRAPGFAPGQHGEPVLEIGDPWRFYRKFWQAHGLENLATIVPLEITSHVDRVLAIPLVINNPLATPLDVNFSVHAPAGWQVAPVAPASVGPRSTYYLRVLATAPAVRPDGWQEISITGEANSKSLGEVKMRAQLLQREKDLSLAA
jgi:LmbE family N-acetylglucosaminyl deacetylase